jgi:LacI family transcriptional regulator
MGYMKLGKGKDSPSRSLGLVIYKKHGEVVWDTSFIDDLVQGIEQEGRDQGYNILLFYYYENGDAARQVSAIMSSSCSGLIILASEMFAGDLNRFSNIALPIVLLDNAFDDLGKDSITCNNRQGATQAMNYLIRQGHRKIGHLHSSVATLNFEERREGYLKVMTQKPGFKDSFSVPLEPTMEGAYRDMKMFLDAKPALPTAFFADNDDIAASAVRAMREAGICVPDDVSIVGFDDSSASTMTDPPLTTMSVPRMAMGCAAVDRLIGRIDGTTESENIRMELNAKLVIRESVKRRVVSEADAASDTRQTESEAEVAPDVQTAQETEAAP